MKFTRTLVALFLTSIIAFTEFNSASADSGFKPPTGQEKARLVGFLFLRGVLKHTPDGFSDKTRYLEVSRIKNCDQAVYKLDLEAGKVEHEVCDDHGNCDVVALSLELIAHPVKRYHAASAARGIRDLFKTAIAQAYSNDWASAGKTLDQLKAYCTSHDLNDSENTVKAFGTNHLDKPGNSNIPAGVNIPNSDAKPAEIAN